MGHQRDLLHSSCDSASVTISEPITETSASGQHWEDVPDAAAMLLQGDEAVSREAFINGNQQLPCGYKLPLSPGVEGPSLPSLSPQLASSTAWAS